MNKEKRHKCSICGSVRYESKMLVITDVDGCPITTRFGNLCWCCMRSQCIEEAKEFSSY